MNALGADQREGTAVAAGLAKMSQIRHDKVSCICGVSPASMPLFRERPRRVGLLRFSFNGMAVWDGSLKRNGDSLSSTHKLTQSVTVTLHTESSQTAPARRSGASCFILCAVLCQSSPGSSFLIRPQVRSSRYCLQVQAAALTLPAGQETVTPHFSL